jgi:uncharacterized membrane protein YphA (DoxX/SURF4 family)
MDPLLENATVLLLLMFMIVTFLQSGMDKLLDWKGNLSWLKGHFADTPFKNSVPVLLAIVLVTELLAGLLCAMGIFQVLITGANDLALYGSILCCVALLMLLFGQRMAKDYDGARTIAIYFVPAIFLVFVLQS